VPSASQGQSRNRGRSSHFSWRGLQDDAGRRLASGCVSADTRMFSSSDRSESTPRGHTLSDLTKISLGSAITRIVKRRAVQRLSIVATWTRVEPKPSCSRATLRVLAELAYSGNPVPLVRPDHPGVIAFDMSATWLPFVIKNSETLGRPVRATGELCLSRRLGSALSRRQLLVFGSSWLCCQLERHSAAPRVVRRLPPFSFLLEAGDVSHRRRGQAERSTRP